ncbi:MAG: hypothetical protein KJI69_06195 [Patescibacteria group bacterium]|nr:hypothetical protein [Patescibacteria group bacterium]
MKNKNIILFIGILIFLAVLSINFTSAAVCCENTGSSPDGNDGAWCIDVDEESICNSNFRTSPTSCESTTYCSVGTCINAQTGECLPSPQASCDSELGGYWDSRNNYDIPQCQTGCCLIGEQAAFVTQTRCEYLASLPEYNVVPQFLNNIQDEQSCIALAEPEVKGACVFQTDSGNSCTIETKQECQERGAEFHEGFLCSAEELNTICGPTERTTCVEGKDEIYFLDSCGNTANIYDSESQDDAEYWTYIKDWTESCNPGESNTDSATCGNCDFYAGSTCSAVERGQNVNMGNYICKDLSCSYDNNGDGTKEKYEHGETFCATPKDWKENAPGREEIRIVCYNGEISAEPCASFRNEVCTETTIDDGTPDGYRYAACVVNSWQTCVAQDNEKDCDNADKRDCKWEENIGDGVCLPKDPPGFNFWDVEEDTETLCAVASDVCVVKKEKGLFGGWDYVENEECLSGGSWETEKQNLCLALGDCGVKVNYVDKKGWWENWKDFFTGEGYDEEE